MLLSYRWIAVALQTLLAITLFHQPYALAAFDDEPASASPQAASSKTSVDALIEWSSRATRLIEEGDFHEAAVLLVPVDRDSDSQRLFDTLKEGRKKSTEMMGKELGVISFVQADISGNAYCRLTYAEKFEYGMIAHRFTFYRGEEGWRFVNYWYGLGDNVLSLCQPSSSELFPEPRKHVEDIVGLFANQKNYDAFDSIKRLGSPRVKASVQSQQIVAYSVSMELSIKEGNLPTSNFEILSMENFGPDFVRIQAVHRLAKSGNDWNFIFYRADREWTLISFSFGSKIDSMFVAHRDQTNLQRK